MPTISSVNAIYPEDFSSGGYTSGFYSKRNGNVYVLDRLSTHAEILMQMFPEVVNAGMCLFIKFGWRYTWKTQLR